MATLENNTGQGRESSVSSESQAAPVESTENQGRESSATSTQAAPSDSQPEAQGRETPRSGNPDHSGGKVESGQVQEDGTVAATEEEKGGSSD